MFGSNEIELKDVSQTSVNDEDANLPAYEVTPPWRIPTVYTSPLEEKIYQSLDQAIKDKNNNDYIAALASLTTAVTTFNLFKFIYIGAPIVKNALQFIRTHRDELGGIILHFLDPENKESLIDKKKCSVSRADIYDAIRIFSIEDQADLFSLCQNPKSPLGARILYTQYTNTENGVFSQKISDKLSEFKKVRQDQTEHRFALGTTMKGLLFSDDSIALQQHQAAAVAASNQQKLAKK